jgi:HPr kinase/phosphorylase
VEIRKVSNKTLYGTSPEIIRHFIELRGIGIIDVREMFGISSIKQTQTVDLAIKLTDWDDAEEYDRLGLVETYHEILGNNIVSNRIPIRPGRNIAIIIEAAAINNRQKRMGYNAAEELNKRVIENASNQKSKE